MRRLYAGTSGRDRRRVRSLNFPTVDAGRERFNGLAQSRAREDITMSDKTCAACDYPLDAGAIRVTVGGKTVEVCCEECATQLKEAHASAHAPG
jgi:hypothetical protein